MEAVFIRLLNMSIAASWLILAVISLRFLLKNAPKSIRRILWALVGIRLVLPFSFESFLSLIPSAETVSPDILYAEAPKIHSGISAFNTYVNPVISESFAPAAEVSVNPMQVVAYIASVVWIIGMITLILYSVISYVRLRRRVADAVILRDNVWQSEKVDSPFVLGLFRPRIYLPFSMDDESLAYVVAHEQAHLRRRDHWIKPIGFLLLTVYWFNPLIWLAYILLCRDIELACDEHVVKRMSVDDKKAYSKALLKCSVNRRAIAACPLAFGEVGVKQRIKSVLNYKKPAFWIIIAALASCVVVSVCFLTNPVKPPISFDNIQINWTKTLDMRGYAPVARDLSEAEISELTDRLRDMKIGREDVDYEGFTPLYSLMINAQGMEQFMIAGYNSDRDNVALSYNGSYYCIDDDEFTQYFSLICAGENITEAVEATAYISQSSIYMNPLSSTLSDGDSGCRYFIGEDSVTVINKKTGEVIAVSSPVSWAWQEISAEEWDALFPLEIGAPDIGSYKNPQVMELSSRYYLFDMDGELWFGDCRSDKVGMWSVYSLAPESTAGVTWEYTPLLSSRVPAFPFRFNLEYTRVEAECTGGHLIGFDDYDSTGYPQGKTLTVPVGSALYWSPQASDEYSNSYALTAQVSFIVYDEDEAVYTGTVSISGTTGTGAATAIYTAVLSEGDGLMLIGAPDTDGALIQSAGTYSTSSVGGIGWPQRLTVAQGDLDGDGADESVSITKKEGDLYVLSVLKANGSELWSAEMSTAHAGWDSLFLCTLEGKDYLLRYNPSMFQGECSYNYTLFTLENGSENVKRTGTVEFDVNGTNLLDVDELSSFADEVNALLKKSILLLSTQGGIVSIGSTGASDFLEDYDVLFASGASNLAEAAVIRAAQVFIRQGADFDTIWNFNSPELNEIDASRFAGMPLFTEDYDADGKLYEVTFNTSDDAVLGPIILFVDSHGVVFGSSGRA